jgi:hypothetical protein
VRRIGALFGLIFCACFTPVAEPCKSARCRLDGGVQCSVGSTQACGSSVGECKPGKQICDPNGHWGPCEGGVTPGIEVCDGKDNNCDGQIDEGVMQVCPLQKGVCAGASGICGGDGGCVAAYGPHYEPVETSCDGLDNDCDGNVDRSVAVNVSQSPGVVSRKPTAVRVPGSESVVVLYEEGEKIAARVINSDGGMSAAVSPSVTVDAVTHAWAPSVAVGPTMIVAAWAEDTGSAKRIMVASLDGTTGQSTLMGGGALFAQAAEDPVEVDVAIDEEAGLMFLVVVESTGLMNLAGFSSTLPPPMGSPSFTRSPYGEGQHATLALLGGGTFMIGYEDPPNGFADRAIIDSMGFGPADETPPKGNAVSFFSADAGSGTSYFVSGDQIVTSDCSVSLSQIACTPPAPAFSFQQSDMDFLRLAWPTLASWQQGVASPQIMSAKLFSNAAMGTALSAGRRPWPVLNSQQVLVFFDTESVASSSVSTDEVYFIRSCR